MKFQIIILAGGKGTRIKPLIGQTPKILASINQKPFIDWLILWINSWDIKTKDNILLSTCIGHNEIKNYCNEKELPIKCVREKIPLGTFGAVANVASKYFAEDYIIINGDTIFKANIKRVSEIYKKNRSEIPLILLREMLKKNNNGGYLKNKNGWIYSSNPSKYISLGTCFISYENLKQRWIKSTSKPFSPKTINNLKGKEIMMDKDCFGNIPINGELFSNQLPFIDIGIPKDYIKSQTYIPNLFQTNKFS